MEVSYAISAFTGILRLHPLVAALMVPMAVFAATDTTEILGDVTQSISITAPTSLDLGTLTVGGTAGYTSDETITVNGNDTEKVVQVTVRDNNQTTDIGKMVSGTSKLSSVLKVKGGDLTSYTALPIVAGNTETMERIFQIYFSALYVYCPGRLKLTAFRNQLFPGGYMHFSQG